MILTRYQPEHQAAMLALHRSALNGFSTGIAPEQEEADLIAIEEVYIARGGEFLIGLQDGKVIAMGGFKRLSQTEAELKRMRVAKILQGQGFGTQLLERLEQLARERGVERLVLQTAAARPLTLEFYRKNGYCESGRSHYGQVETVRFAKNLDSAAYAGEPDLAQVDFLVNQQRFLPVLTEAMYEHWQSLLEALGRSREDFTKSMRDRCRADSLPLALVAFREGKVLGTVALKPQDLDIRPNLTPWLGGLFVMPKCRGRGIGSLLIARIVVEARRLGLPGLYLWTPSAERLYARHGWRVLERVPYHHYCISIMHRQLPAGQRASGCIGRKTD